MFHRWNHNEACKSFPRTETELLPVFTRGYLRLVGWSSGTSLLPVNTWNYVCREHWLTAFSTPYPLDLPFNMELQHRETVLTTFENFNQGNMQIWGNGAVNLYYFQLTTRVLMRGIKILAAYNDEGVRSWNKLIREVERNDGYNYFWKVISCFLNEIYRILIFDKHKKSRKWKMQKFRMIVRFILNSNGKLFPISWENFKLSTVNEKTLLKILMQYTKTFVIDFSFRWQIYLISSIKNKKTWDNVEKFLLYMRRNEKRYEKYNPSSRFLANNSTISIRVFVILLLSLLHMLAKCLNFIMKNINSRSVHGLEYFFPRDSTEKPFFFPLMWRVIIFHDTRNEKRKF